MEPSHHLLCRKTPSVRRVGSFQTSRVLRRSRDQLWGWRPSPGRSEGQPRTLGFVPTSLALAPEGSAQSDFLIHRLTLTVREQ